MINVSGTKVHWGPTLLKQRRRSMFQFELFGEKQPKFFRVNLSSRYVISSALHSEFKLAERERRNEENKIGNVSDSRDFGQQQQRKPRCLCLHGFRTNGEILKKQIRKWPKSVHNKIDFVFVDAPFPAQGKSDVEGIFDPPFYEWFQFDKDFMEYRNLYECLAYIEDCMLKHGPIDGVMGFSLGAILSAALPGFQASGVALTKVPKLKFLILVAGGKFLAPTVAEKAFPSPIECPTLHFLGDGDFMKPNGVKLLDSFVDPLVIHHHKGHTIPRLDEKAMEIMLKFLDKIQGNQFSCSGLATSLGEEMNESGYME